MDSNRKLFSLGAAILLTAGVIGYLYNGWGAAEESKEAVLPIEEESKDEKVKS